ncbi:hypothetical protein J7E88_23155 [Streptomyces sp. ISL-10]|uniref:hypothetical protein n=1 Tax=Streptomyces sp. ISL-10 TaxID=2819172 RepID=UPI001BED29D6|nr:hypothetical protein [Streptomyces sp. ISL-10]MBT2368136.1 hypothetical protein [Streptomyces sp. ISL-10]
MFTWLFVIGWSAFALPLAIAMLRGWAPRRVRRRISPWGIQVRGIALLVLWVGGLVGPLVRQSGLDIEEATILASMTSVGFLMFAGGLMSGSQLGEWFYRRAGRSQALDAAQDVGGQPYDTESVGRLRGGGPAT